MGRVAPLVLVAVGWGGIAQAGVLSAYTPTAGPSVAVLGSWQKITGKVDTGTEDVSYELYVNPKREALYEVTRYRVTHHSTGDDGRRQSVSESEKFLWNSHPGTGELLRCFELLSDGSWVQMKTGSPEYRNEMGTATYVYGLHRRTFGRSGFK
jgi:hypothetical protein